MRDFFRELDHKSVMAKNGEHEEEDAGDDNDDYDNDNANDNAESKDDIGDDEHAAEVS